jgi:hypothetical protein
MNGLMNGVKKMGGLTYLLSAAAIIGRFHQAL